MAYDLPFFLSQGETAHLFPVLSITSKEGRTTAILLACMERIKELYNELLKSADQRVGVRTKMVCFTEIVASKSITQQRERPDGLIILKSGKREWKAFVEAKIGKNELDSNQIERYRNLAKECGIDYILTISNQFATTPKIHPLQDVRRSRSKIPVIHWSWMYVLTTVDLLISQQSIENKDQLLLLNEFRRFLSHESAGVRGFDRMPKEWTELNHLISTGGTISTNSNEAIKVIDAWHQETRDLSLALSRLTETRVRQKLYRNHKNNLTIRQKDEIVNLRENRQLSVSLEIPNAAALIDVVVDIPRRCIDVGMTLTAPEDRKSNKARVNWLLRQIKQEDVTDLHLRIFWKNTKTTTQHSVVELRENVEIIEEGKEHLTVKSFHLFYSKRLGPRFTQQSGFIADLEKIVPDFYAKFGSTLIEWRKPAPVIRTDKSDSSDVFPESISNDADASRT
ncbi:MAG: hypothetical protein OXC62_15150 [Aestuariivita sp.]|nr:hypothetical protein [Aestuariivita sp.]